MSPLPFEVLTNGHCQGPKHLVVGDALLRRFGLEYDPEPVLVYLSANNPKTISLERTRSHRLGLEREFAEVSLFGLEWMARNIAMVACETKYKSSTLDEFLQFTSTFDVIHSPNVGTIFPIMSARSTQILEKAKAEEERIRKRTSAPDEIDAMIRSYVHGLGADASWLAEYQQHSKQKIDLELFADIIDSKSYQMHVDNLSIYSFPSSPPNQRVGDRVFSSQVAYTLGNGNVLGPKLSKWYQQHVDNPFPLCESEGDVIMLAEDFMELRSGDVLHDQIANNKDLREFHIIMGEEKVQSVEAEINKADEQSKSLSLGRELDFVGWPAWQVSAPLDRHLLPASG